MHPCHLGGSRTHLLPSGKQTNSLQTWNMASRKFVDLPSYKMVDLSIPIGSMYAIYGNIYHQYTPNVSIYTSTMDPMG